MSKVHLIVDSSCDLPTPFYETYNIRVIDLLIVFNEREYVDRKEITTGEILDIYEKSNVYPKTSALNIPQFEEIFTRELQTYDHVIYLTLSSFLSSVNNNARIAAKELGVEDKVTVLDSLSVSSGIALEAIGIAEDIKENKSVEEIVSNHEERVSKVSMSYVINSTEFLHRGGRCSGLTYLLGNKLKMHPIVRLDNGKMGVHTLVKGKKIKKGVVKMVDQFLEDFHNDNIDFSYPIFIPHVEGDYGVKKIIKHLDGVVGKEILRPVDASGIICCHCGRDTVGLGYMLKKPLSK